MNPLKRLLLAAAFAVLAAVLFKMAWTVLVI